MTVSFKLIKSITESVTEWGMFLPLKGSENSLLLGAKRETSEEPEDEKTHLKAGGTAYSAVHKSDP